jgi:hypothetical protein
MSRQIFGLSCCIYSLMGGTEALSNLIWPRGLRRRPAAARLLGLRVRVPTGHECLSLVSVVCCTGRGLCDELITRPEESYRLWCFLCVI